jgi:hypothetical protein
MASCRTARRSTRSQKKWAFSGIDPIRLGQVGQEKQRSKASDKTVVSEELGDYEGSVS